MKKAKRSADSKKLPLKLNAAQRGCIERAIRQHCEHRQWHLFALNVRTNHIHAAVFANKRPERVLGQLKAYASRALREKGLIGGRKQVWTAGGGTRYLFTDEALTNACNYVMYAQGPDLPKL